MHAREHRRARHRLERRADAGDPLVHARRAAAFEQVVDAQVIHVLEAQAGRDGEAPELEPVLHEPGPCRHLAVAVLLDACIAARAGLPCIRRVAVRLHPVLVFLVVTDSRVEHVLDAEQRVLQVEAGLDARSPVLAQATLVAAGRVEVGEAAAGRVAGVVGPLARVARLPPPVPVEVRVIGAREELRAVAHVELVRRGRGPVGRVHVVVLERVAARIVFPLREREARVRDLGFLVVVAAAQRERLAIGQLLHHLHEHVADLEVHVLARAVGFLPGAVQQVARAADRVAHLAVELQVVLGADRRADAACELVRDAGRDVVDEATERLRAEHDLRRALQNLDALEAVDRRVVVARVVAIGSERKEDSVLEHQQLGGAGRVEAPDAEVGSQAESFLVASEDAGDLAHRLVHREDVRFLEHRLVEHHARAGDRVEVGALADDHDDRLELGQHSPAAGSRSGRRPERGGSIPRLPGASRSGGPSYVTC